MDTRFGFCHLSLIPIRTAPSDKSELSTQLIFGQTYELLTRSEDKKWLKVRIEEDAYEGWLSQSQFYEISSTEAASIKRKTAKILIDTLAWVQHSGFSFPIPLGAALPWDEKRRFAINQDQFLLAPRAQILPPQAARDQILSRALLYRKSPYLWGGKSPLGIDCSGFTQMVYKMMGLLLPRDAYQQAEEGEIVKQLGQVQTGDLAFFQREGRIVHVGLVVAPLDLLQVPGYESPHGQSFLLFGKMPGHRFAPALAA
ncbi:MAG: C40 family peptidase [Bacteroidota bacterium]